MRTSLFFICLLGVFLCSCGDDIHKGYRAPGYDQVLEKQRILNNTKAVKSINSYDNWGVRFMIYLKEKKVKHFLIMNWEMIRKKEPAVLS